MKIQTDGTFTPASSIFSSVAKLKAIKHRTFFREGLPTKQYHDWAFQRFSTVIERAQPDWLPATRWYGEFLFYKFSEVSVKQNLAARLQRKFLCYESALFFNFISCLVPEAV